MNDPLKLGPIGQISRSVRDIQQSERWYRDVLKSRGVEFVSAPHMIHKHPDGTEEWMAFFKDPEERPLALMSQVKQAPP